MPTMEYGARPLRSIPGDVEYCSRLVTNRARARSGFIADSSPRPTHDSMRISSG
jgi:hypothetical protein